MPNPIPLHIATTNPGKLRDFAAALTSPDIQLLPLPGLATLPVAPEDTDSFLGNATGKALFYAALAPTLLVLADDSGLEVDALQGEPGVHSAYFAQRAGFRTSRVLPADQANNLCLLDRLATTPEPRRTARYQCVLALARCPASGQPATLLASAAGTVEGEIVAVPRGLAGFGYDPLFLLPELGLTMAELPLADRQLHSHRGRALAALLAGLSLDQLT